MYMNISSFCPPVVEFTNVQDIKKDNEPYSFILSFLHILITKKRSVHKSLYPPKVK